jgi:glycosyltransferase involved in cell wall biosynthesis
MEKITIGIPTYRRPESLIKLLENINTLSDLNIDIDVLIIDDSGAEDFNVRNKKGIESFKDLKINFIINQFNLGLPRTFLKLLSECKTKYLLLMADDDVLIKDNLLRILDFLEKENPDLLSPQWLYKSGKYGRGINSTRKVTPEEHRLCCGHAPGVIFNVLKAKEFLTIIEDRIDQSCNATLTYPLVALSIPMILSYDNCYWYGKPIAMEGDACESGLKDSKGNHYSSTASRIQQIAAFDDYLLTFAESENREKILASSRSWSFQKVLNSNKSLRMDVLRYIRPSLSFRIGRKINLFLNKK